MSTFDLNNLPDNKTYSYGEQQWRKNVANLHSLSSTYPSDTQILVWNNTKKQYVPVTLSGGATMTNAGVVTLGSTTPNGTAGGDLSFTYPNPTVAKINGNVLGSTALTNAGDVLAVSDSHQWNRATLSGAITMSGSGVTTLGAVTPSAISFLANTSAAKTPTASGNWSAGSATITLTAGTWMVYGATFFYNGGTSPQYTQLSYVLATADGADSGSEPAAVATAGNVTLKGGVTDGRGATNSTSDLFGNASGATVNNYSAYLAMETVLVAVSANTTIYLVPFATLAGTASNARVKTDLWALKVSTATS